MISTSRSLNTTTRCHSVRSLRSPLALSFQLSDVATDMLATRVPSLVERISGSRPRLPIRITLLTLPAIDAPLFYVYREPLRNSTIEHNKNVAKGQACSP